MLLARYGLHGGNHGFLRAPRQLSDISHRCIVSIRAQLKLDGFAKLPYVPPADEFLRSAVRRSLRLQPRKKLTNEAQSARASAEEINSFIPDVIRNLSARQLDCLTKELAVPLNRILQSFPRAPNLHPFEQALLALTVGQERYDRHLAGVNSLRKSLLEVGNGFANRATKSKKKADAIALQEEGFASLQSVFAKGLTSLDNLKQVAQDLRRLPYVDVHIPTVALVGAPNVGKSSIVQSLSSGVPEICDYPFTTRNVKLGHFFVDGKRHQVTDTPGLLHRPDEERNAMENLTLACLQHLPTAVLFVMDLTGECGTPVAHQWLIRARLKAKFPHKAWLDVLSKADLLESVFAEADSCLSGTRLASAGPDGSQKGPDQVPAAGTVAGGVQARLETGHASAPDVVVTLPTALRISSVTGHGIAVLKAAVLMMLADNADVDDARTDPPAEVAMQ